MFTHAKSAEAGAGDGQGNLGRIWIGGCGRGDEEAIEGKMRSPSTAGAAVNVIPQGMYHAAAAKKTEETKQFGPASGRRTDDSGAQGLNFKDASGNERRT